MSRRRSSQPPRPTQPRLISPYTMPVYDDSGRLVGFVDPATGRMEIKEGRCIRYVELAALLALLGGGVVE